MNVNCPQCGNSFVVLVFHGCAMAPNRRNAQPNLANRANRRSRRNRSALTAQAQGPTRRETNSPTLYGGHNLRARPQNNSSSNASNGVSGNGPVQRRAAAAIRRAVRRGRVPALPRTRRPNDSNDVPVNRRSRRNRVTSTTKALGPTRMQLRSATAAAAGPAVRSALGVQRLPRSMRPAKCAMCGKELSNHSNLRRHVMIHHNIRRFPCTHCQKRFGQKTHLNKHMRIMHSNE